MANDLEQALKRATREPGARPALYRLLLKSRVYVLAAESVEGEPITIWNAQIVAWVRDDGVKVIPMFTSSARIKKAPAPNAPRYATILGVRALFETRPDSAFHLNPGSEFDLQLSSDDVRSLLARGVISRGVERGQLDDDMNIFVLSEEHPALISALIALLADDPSVHQAYMFEGAPRDSGKRSLMILLVADQSDETLIESISSIAEDVYTGRLPIDVLRDGPGGPMHTSLSKEPLEPFYDRKWGRRMARDEGGTQ